METKRLYRSDVQSIYFIISCIMFMKSTRPYLPREFSEMKRKNCSLMFIKSATDWPSVGSMRSYALIFRGGNSSRA